MRVGYPSIATIISLLMATFIAHPEVPQESATVLSISSSAAATAVHAADQRTPVREIDDPQTGARWMLYASTDGGPGKLLLVQPGVDPLVQSGVLANHTTTGVWNQVPLQLKPIIRGGERVLVEEHTPVVDALLEAIALGPARQDATLRVRLKIGGAIVQAVVLGPGRVAFAPLTGDKP